MIDAIIVGAAVCIDVPMPVDKAVLGELIGSVLAAADTGMPHVGFFIRPQGRQAKVKAQLIRNFPVVVAVDGRDPIAPVPVQGRHAVHAEPFGFSECIV